MNQLIFSFCDKDITKDAKSPTISRVNPQSLPCANCGSTERKVGIGKGSHTASLQCGKCDLLLAAALRYRFIKWVGKSELAKIEGGQV